jgi:hypothetical protein
MQIVGGVTYSINSLHPQERQLTMLHSDISKQLFGEYSGIDRLCLLGSSSLLSIMYVVQLLVAHILTSA